MSEKIISIDVDGIIADFYGGIHERYNKPVEPTPVFEVPWIGEVYQETADDHTFWEGLGMMIKPEEIEFDYHYYISTLRETMHGARTNWINNNGYLDRPLHLSDDKHIVCEELGVNIHIDDKLSTIINIKNYCTNTTPILHVPDYLQYENIPDGIIVTRTVEQLNQAVKSLM